MRNVKPQVFRDLEFLVETLIPRVTTNLRWAANCRFSRLEVVDDVRVSTSGRSDPTGELATGKRQTAMKEAIRQAERQIREAVEQLESADKALAKAFGPGSRDSTLKDSLISDDERREAERMKEKREAAGHGWGQG